MVLIVNNNQWAIPVPRTCRARRRRHKKIAAGVEGRQIDGNDVTRSATTEALAKARAGGGTTLTALTLPAGRLHNGRRCDALSRCRDGAPPTVPGRSRGAQPPRAKRRLGQGQEEALQRECAEQVSRAVDYLALPPGPDAMFDTSTRRCRRRSKSSAMRRAACASVAKNVAEVNFVESTFALHELRTTGRHRVGVNGGVPRHGRLRRLRCRAATSTRRSPRPRSPVSPSVRPPQLEPVAEIQFTGFIYPTLDQIINHASRMRHGRADACLAHGAAPVGCGNSCPRAHWRVPRLCSRTCPDYAW
jgi:hypothetical protein